MVEEQANPDRTILGSCFVARNQQKFSLARPSHLRALHKTALLSILAVQPGNSDRHHHASFHSRGKACLESSDHESWLASVRFQGLRVH